MLKTFLSIGLSISLLSVSGISLAQPGGLPPGLQKKAEHNQPLPPGWQKKVEVGRVLDADIYAHARVVVPLGKDGAITVTIDGTLLRLEEKTRKILQIIEG